VDLSSIISSGLLELYAAGLANATEREQVAAWVKQYPEVAAELKEIELSLEAYAQANAVQPAAPVKEKIWQTIEHAAGSGNGTALLKPAVVTPLKNYWKFASAASVALLIGSAVMNYIFYNKMTAASSNLQQVQEQLAVQEQQVKDATGYLNTVQNKYSQPVSLNGTPETPDAVAKIFWMKNTGEVFIDPSNLPETPAGKQYQLWAFVDGKPVDAGIILNSKNGNAYRIQKMKTFGKAEAFAVTLEDAGPALTAPKGKVLVVGKI
jgi:hypothetical protein